MKTITLDILDDKAINLLKDLEEIKIIRLHKDNEEPKTATVDFVAKYKGAMTKQPPKEIDRQLDEMRNEWV